MRPSLLRPCDHRRGLRMALLFPGRPAVLRNGGVLELSAFPHVPARSGEKPSCPLGDLYHELHALAGRIFRHEQHDSVLQKTALVHEACLRLLDREGLKNANKIEILALASVAMRHFLVDRARSRNREKRSATGERVSIDKVSLAYENRAIDLLALNDALNKLSQFDLTMARAVELRFFSGLSMEETSRCLELPLRTLERRWEATRLWLRVQVG